MKKTKTASKQNFHVIAAPVHTEGSSFTWTNVRVNHTVGNFTALNNGYTVRYDTSLERLELIFSIFPTRRFNLGKKGQCSGRTHLEPTGKYMSTTNRYNTEA